MDIDKWAKLEDRLKKLLTILILIVFLVPLGCNSSSQAGKSGENSAAHKIMVQDDTGKNVRLSEFHGKKVVAVFWATWCPACRQAVPHLNKVTPMFNKEGAEVLAISGDMDKNQAKKYFGKFKPSNMKLMFDSAGHARNQLGIPGIPTCVVFNPKGAIVDVSIGCNVDRLMQTVRN